MKKGAAWPIFLASLLGMNVVVVGITVYLANHDSGFRVEPAYYQKAIRFADRQRQLDTNRQLGWIVTFESLPGAIGADRPVRVTISDGSGLGISGAAIEGVAFHNAHAGLQVPLTFSESQPGRYTGSIPGVTPGLWTIQMVISRGADRFTQDFEQVLAVVPTGIAR